MTLGYDYLTAFQVFSVNPEACGFGSSDRFSSLISPPGPQLGGGHVAQGQGAVHAALRKLYRLQRRETRVSCPRSSYLFHSDVDTAP